MNLLGDGAHWLAIACGLLGLVGGTAAVSWVVRRRWLNVGKNLVSLVLAATLLMVAVGLELNRANAWYPSWDDIFGTPDVNVPVQQVGAKNTDRTFGKVAVTTTDSRKLPALPGGTSRIQNFTVKTAEGAAWPVQVVLPKDYFAPANANKAYPVIFFAHGVPGGNAVWQTRMSITKLLDPVVDAGKVRPFIAVVPEVTPQGMDTECEIGPSSDTETEDWLAVQVPKFVREHLRVAPQRESWAMAGYSAGGWCAAFLPIHHPDVFGAGIVLGGYFEPWWGAAKPHWSAKSAEAKRLDLATVVNKARPRVALYVQSAKNDRESWPTTKKFLAKVESPTFVDSEIEASGGHSFDLWTLGLEHGVVWLGEKVPGFKP